MKKSIACLFLSFFICFSLAACGPKSLDEVVNDADHQVAEWEEQGFDGYTYIGEYEEEKNCYYVVIQSEIHEDNMLSPQLVEITCKMIEEKITKIFEDIEGAMVMIGVLDQNGDILYMYSGGRFITD